MEKKRNQLARHKTNGTNNLLDYLPRAASMAVTFPNRKFIPDRSTGFSSGPITVSLVPEEIRRKPRKAKGICCDDKEEEPNSPKVSCIGQIKMHNSCNNNNTKKKNTLAAAPSKALTIESKPLSLPASRSDNFRRHHHHNHGDVQYSGNGNTVGEFDQVGGTGKHTNNNTKKQSFKIFRKLLGRDSKTPQKHDQKVIKSTVNSNDENDGRSFGGSTGSNKSESVPSLGQMKRFVSGRHSLDSFDWTTQITPIEEKEEKVDSEEEKLLQVSSAEEEDEDGGDQLMLEPRKEVNLWKRRNFSSSLRISQD